MLARRETVGRGGGGAGRAWRRVCRRGARRGGQKLEVRRRHPIWRTVHRIDTHRLAATCGPNSTNINTINNDLDVLSMQHIQNRYLMASKLVMPLHMLEL